MCGGTNTHEMETIYRDEEWERGQNAHFAFTARFYLTINNATKARALLLFEINVWENRELNKNEEDEGKKNWTKHKEKQKFEKRENCFRFVELFCSCCLFHLLCVEWLASVWPVIMKLTTLLINKRKIIILNSGAW